MSASLGFDGEEQGKYKVSFRDRFMEEYQGARVNLILTEEGYDRYAPALFPDKLVVVDMIVHATWIVAALVFAFKTSEMSLLTTIGVSLGGMLLSLLLATFLPSGFLLGGTALLLAILALPRHIAAGPVGLYGLHSLSKGLSRWYGRDLVTRWCIGTEDQFLQSVAERIIIVSPNRFATETTKGFLKELAEATGRIRTVRDEA